jgi:hypothetical protein
VTVTARFRVWSLCALAWLWMAALPAQAHDPFDGGVRLVVFDDRIEADVTLGYDAARAVLGAAGMAPGDVGRATRAHGAGAMPLPAAVATRLLTLRGGTLVLVPRSVLAAPARDETHFLLTYARPATQHIGVHAGWFTADPFMRPGAAIMLDAQQRLVASAPLSRTAPAADLPLTALAARAAPPMRFAAYLQLGVEHILGGYDHLLFLAALLLGLHALRAMLGIVTVFALAHSITLALAVLDVVAVPPALIEPLIAASIIVACVANLLPRETTHYRYALAAGFGLVHGFGFAGALRATGLGGPGTDIAVPLLAFNLGVEAGQLAVACVLAPLLLLARRQPAFARYGLPGLSVGVACVSAMWLVERVAQA